MITASDQSDSEEATLELFEVLEEIAIQVLCFRCWHNLIYLPVSVMFH